MKKKNFLALALSLVMLFSLVAPNYALAAGEDIISEEKTVQDISIGDYINFGSLFGDDITWQVIGEEEGKYLLFSAHTLFNGHYDASLSKYLTNNVTSYYRYGSNSWRYSDIRTFLNSESTEVQYPNEVFDYSNLWHGIVSQYYGENVAPNYASIPGFLNSQNFSRQELNILSPTTHAALIDYTDPLADTTQLFPTVSATFSNWDSVKANYSLCQSAESTDKVFLLSAQEVQKYLIDQGLSINAEYIGNLASYWLRDCIAQSTSSYNAYHGIYSLAINNSTLSFAEADALGGIRPACWIAPNNNQTLTGNGTLDNPYILFADIEVSDTKYDLENLEDRVVVYTALSKLSYSDGMGQYIGKSVPDAVKAHANNEYTRCDDIMWTDQDITYEQFYTDVLGNYIIADYINKNSENGFCAICYKDINSGNYIISYRGSEGGNILGGVIGSFFDEDFSDPNDLDEDWITDFKFALHNELSSQFKDAYNFYSQVKKKADAEGAGISLTGHSLGGGLAAYVSILSGEKAYCIDPAVGHVIDLVYFFMIHDIGHIQGHNIEIANNIIVYTDEEVDFAFLIQSMYHGKYPLYMFHPKNIMNIAEQSQEELKYFGSHHPISYLEYDYDSQKFGLVDPEPIAYYDNNNSGVWSMDVSALEGFGKYGIPPSISGLFLYGLYYMMRDGRVTLCSSLGNTYYAPSIPLYDDIPNVIYGGLGPNKLVAFGGSDIIIAGGSSNELHGGTGSDLYVIDKDYGDHISVFDPSGRDLILLRGWTCDEKSASNCISSIRRVNRDLFGFDQYLEISLNETDQVLIVDENRNWFSPNIEIAVETDTGKIIEIDVEELLHENESSGAGGRSLMSISNAEDKNTSEDNPLRTISIQGDATLVLTDLEGNILKEISSAYEEFYHSENGYFYGIPSDTGNRVTAVMFNPNCQLFVKPSGSIDVCVYQHTGSNDTFSDAYITQDLSLGNSTMQIKVYDEDGTPGFYIIDNISGTQQEIASIHTVYAQSILVTPNELKLVPGEEEHLKVEWLPTNTTDKSVMWSSNDENIVRVSEDGMVSAIGVGEAIITVKSSDGKHQADCKVTVSYQNTGNSTNPNKPVIESPDLSDDNESDSESISMPFVDVVLSDWFYEAVANVYKNGLMSGISTTVFAPRMVTSRGMIVTILYRLSGSTIVSDPATFTDVAKNQWYTDAITWAAANNIVNGYGNGMFGPNDSITREQMATILYRYAQYKGYTTTINQNLSNFTDGDSASDWAVEALEWAVSQGVMAGKDGNMLDPTGTATRAEVAQMFFNYLTSLQS